MKFILTTDNAGAIPAHFRKLEIAADEGRMTLADVRFTDGGARPPAIVKAAEKLVAQANSADDLLDVLREWTEYAVNRDIPFPLISKTRLVLQKAGG